MRDRSVALLSGRWVTVTTLGGILAGLAAMVTFRLLSWMGSVEKQHALTCVPNRSQP